MYRGLGYDGCRVSGGIGSASGVCGFRGHGGQQGCIGWQGVSGG